ncbi:hypothetical protein L6164_018974 [Bauhinia variegata]|uniref:Uncharacterized protein n=1 Tax=Bauhinia variegata TaxID=167791 RepID=A0ACB9NE05_BAUVA|nr:hypothetical protein L6164_018974 [Bauhinia variegata]
MAISARHQLLMELHTLLSQSHTTEYIKGQWPWNLSKHVCAVLALDHNVQHDVLQSDGSVFVPLNMLVSESPLQKLNFVIHALLLSHRKSSADSLRLHRRANLVWSRAQGHYTLEGLGVAFLGFVFAYTYMNNIIPKAWYNWGDPNGEMHATLSLFTLDNMQTLVFLFYLIFLLKYPSSSLDHENIHGQFTA